VTLWLYWGVRLELTPRSLSADGLRCGVVGCAGRAMVDVKVPLRIPLAKVFDDSQYIRFSIRKRRQVRSKARTKD
jgi:hypothetical protein